MKNLCLAMLCAGLMHANSAIGQAGSDWNKVKALSAGTTVHVSSLDRRPFACELVVADDAELTCVDRRSIFLVPVTRRMVFARGRVKEVRLTNRGVSTLAGGAIGLGVGVGVGYAVDNRATQAEDPGLAEAVFGMLGALVGAAVGHGTDFINGSSVYRAP